MVRIMRTKCRSEDAAAAGAPADVDVGGEEITEADEHEKRAGAVDFQDGAEPGGFFRAELAFDGAPFFEAPPCEAGEEAEEEDAVEDGLGATGEMQGDAGHGSGEFEADALAAAGEQDGGGFRAEQGSDAIGLGEEDGLGRHRRRCRNRRKRRR